MNSFFQAGCSVGRRRRRRTRRKSCSLVFPSVIEIGVHFASLHACADHSNHPRESALKDVHGNHKHELPDGAVTHHLGEELASNNITHVFCVGTAGDLCVSHTAMDAADMGFKAYVIEDVTMSFDAGEGWPAMKKELKAKGVEVVKKDGPEVGKVRALGGKKAEGQGNKTTMVFHGIFNGPVFFGYSAEQAKGLM